jgi:hypothetical protein
VRISGLKSAKGSELNGKVGVAQHYQNHRIAVQIEGHPSLVSVSIQNLTPLEETLPHVLTTIAVADTGTRKTMLLGGRTLIECDLVSIFMERCLVEQASNNSSKRNRLRCAACGEMPDAMVTCAGCGLCQWCDNSDCQRRFVEAGHGLLCRQYRALREIFDNQVIQQAAMLFQSAATQQIAYTMVLQEAARLAKAAKLNKEHAEMIEKVCHYAVQWPASAEISTTPPGTKVQLSEDLIDHEMMLPGSCVQSAARVPGKLTLCATSHKAKLNALSKKQLREMHTLPCGNNSDATHAPIQTTLRDLSIRRNQQSLCSKGCNDHDNPSGAGKTILSNVYYSFCLDRVCNASDVPGSIQHCPMCGLCRNYMYAHTSCCNKCSYGSKMRVMPCMHCHDLVLGHDGVIFIPRSSEQCSSSPVTGIATVFRCACAGGRVVWRDANPSTRRPFVCAVGSNTQQATSSRAPLGLADPVMKLAVDASVELAWMNAQNYPVERVNLIDMFMKNKELKAPPKSKDARNSLCVGSLWNAADEICEQRSKATDAFMNLFKGQYDVADTSIPFEAWLISERENAAIAAKLEYQELRKAGKPVEKMRYKEVLAERCHSCGEKATEYKDLKACSLCHSGYYCGAACQRKDWANHKKLCRPVVDTANLGDR